MLTKIRYSSKLINFDWACHPRPGTTEKEPSLRVVKRDNTHKFQRNAAFVHEIPGTNLENGLLI